MSTSESYYFELTEPAHTDFVPVVKTGCICRKGEDGQVATIESGGVLYVLHSPQCEVPGHGSASRFVGKDASKQDYPRHGEKWTGREKK